DWSTRFHENGPPDHTKSARRWGSDGPPVAESPAAGTHRVENARRRSEGDGTAMEVPDGESGCLQGDARAPRLPRALWARSLAAESRLPASVAAERVRVLHRHAHEGRAG